jgi:hypothetical protein
MSKKTVFLFFNLGILLGMLVTFVVIKPSVDRIAASASTCFTERQKLQTENESLKHSFDDLTSTTGSLMNTTKMLLAQRTDETSVATILYEPAPRGEQILAGVMMLAGHPMPTPANVVPKWLIPLKVKPTLIGSPAGMQVFYFHPDTKQTEGPFAPEILPQ